MAPSSKKSINWEVHRAKIEDLYWSQDKALTEVMERMKKDHGIQATYGFYYFTCLILVSLTFYHRRKMYKRQILAWDLGKNIKKHEMITMLRIEERRRKENKETRFLFRGKVVDRAKLRRFTTRYRLKPPFDDDDDPNASQGILPHPSSASFVRRVTNYYSKTTHLALPIPLPNRKHHVCQCHQKPRNPFQVRSLARTQQTQKVFTGRQVASDTRSQEIPTRMRHAKHHYHRDGVLTKHISLSILLRRILCLPIFPCSLHIRALICQIWNKPPCPPFFRCHGLVKKATATLNCIFILMLMSHLPLLSMTQGGTDQFKWKALSIMKDRMSITTIMYCSTVILRATVCPAKDLPTSPSLWITSRMPTISMSLRRKYGDLTTPNSIMYPSATTMA